MMLNGIPKSGNHALQKACALLGVSLPINHIEYADKSDGEYIFISRHPRNMLCSSARSNGAPISSKALIAEIENYLCYGSLADVIRRYQEWLYDDDTYVIHYEDLSTRQGFEWLAAILNVQVNGDEFKKLPGGTETWTGAPSDWREYWTPEVDAVWLDSGCAMIEESFNRRRVSGEKESKWN